jgi:hypothetical protein
LRRNLKKARHRDKVLSANNLKKKLQEQERSFTSDFQLAQDGHKKAEEGWEITEANYAKEATRRDRTVASLSDKLNASNGDLLQASGGMEKLRTQHAEVVLQLAVLKKKKHGSAMLEIKDLRRNADNMKDRHRAKVEKLTTEIIEWRDSTLAQVVSTKVSKRKSAPFTEDFEHCSRGMLATGVGAQVCVDAFQRVSDFILPPGKARENFVVPQKRWYSKLRESVGYVAWVHAAIEISEAEYILQFGYDETQIMRQGTMNLWALTWGKNKKLKIVTMEAAGLLIGGTSREIAHHIKTQFGRMQAAVLLVRARLGDDADRLCTMANGGVQLLKILSAMHDTCNCANKVVTLCVFIPPLFIFLPSLSLSPLSLFTPLSLFIRW